MTPIEYFTAGKKKDRALCEDIIVMTENFMAVIDGATSKSCPAVGEMSGGRFAAQTVAAAIAVLPADIAPAAAIAQLSGALHRAVSAHMDAAAVVEKPSCCLAVYSRARREVWRVGDIGVLVDGAAHMAAKTIDSVTAAARGAMIEALLREGETIQSLQADDKGRAFIFPLLARQHLFANRADAGIFGYGVMNGDDIPPVFVDVIAAAQAREIVLASDGYPELRPTLAGSEAALQDILREDPLLYRRHPSTKGCLAGQESFDDRSYLRFAI